MSQTLFTFISNGYTIVNLRNGCFERQLVIYNGNLVANDKWLNGDEQC